MMRRYQVVKFLCLISVFFSIVELFGIIKVFVAIDYKNYSYPLNENVLEYARKKRFNKQLDVNPINIYNYTFVYNPADKCNQNVTFGAAMQLIFLVKSAVEYFDRRATIRKTWGNKSNYPFIRIVFLVGSSENNDVEEKVKKEFDLHNDIVKINYIDSYYNNTIKTLMGFRWAVNNCSESPYFMFVDDDYYVSTKNALHFIQSMSKNQTISNKSVTNDSPNISESNHKTKLVDISPGIANDQFKLFAGFQFISSPHRYKWSKWYVSLKEYPYNMWPPYVTGGAYILSREALLDIYYVSMFTKHFKFDDVYVGMLALRARVNITHSDEFYFRKATYSKPSDYKHVIATHGYGDHNELMRIWSECYIAGFA